MFGTLLEGTNLLNVSIAAVVALALSYAVAQFAARMVRTLFVHLQTGETPVDFSSPIVRRPIRLVRLAVFAATAAALAPPALDLAGLDLAEGMSTGLREWILASGLRVVIIATVAYVVVRVIANSARRLEEEIGQSTAPDRTERLKRARTVGGLVQNILTTVVSAVAILMILRELRIDIMPILTGAGIVGLAVGFGAQTLVKDFISGFFLTIEDHVRVGDVVNLNGTGGLVEAMNLRTTVLRDLQGTVHVFPNGAIERLSNLTKDFSYYVIDMGVAYKEDTDHVVSVLEEVATELREDPQYRPHILAPLEVLGVDSFGDSQVVIKIRIKTVPLQQWFVGREFRRRIKKAFDLRGIEIPFPHRSLYFGEASKPILFKQATEG